MLDPLVVLLQPDHLTTRSEVLSRLSPVPAASGVYAWHFDVALPGMPLEDTRETDFGRLLYVGIAPRQPRRSDNRPSNQTLRKRIRNHYRGNASGSTLRLTLGSLLAPELGLQLRRVGRTERLTFGDGESALSEWMDEHARVCWYVDPEPWLIESKLISELTLPLNLDQNRYSGFHAVLTAARHNQRETARSLPVLLR